jgi:hypothetical protein
VTVCDWNGYFLFQRNFGVLAMWRERSTHLANLCTMAYDLRADCVAYS